MQKGAGARKILASVQQRLFVSFALRQLLQVLLQHPLS